MWWRAFLLLSGVLFSFTAVNAEENGFFVIDKTKFSVKENSVVEIKNIPPVRDQGGAGFCYAAAAADAIDAANCRDEEVDCLASTDKQRASMLDLAGSGSGGILSSGGGDPFFAVYSSVFKRGYVVREQCAPMSTAVAGITLNSLSSSYNSDLAVQAAAFNDARAVYDQIHAKLGDFKGCDAYNCQKFDLSYAPTSDEKMAIDRLLKEFRTEYDGTYVLKELSAPTFEIFISHVLVPAICIARPRNTTGISLMRRYIDYFPKQGEKQRNYSGSIKKIRSILQNGDPVIMSICALDKYPADINKCQAFHAFLLSGYRKMCDKDAKCVDALKVHNSWGELWQREHDDGWVNAKALLDRTYYTNGSMVWLARSW